MLQIKTLANGEHRLIFHVYKNEKKESKSLVISVNSDNWNFFRSYYFPVA